MGVAGDVGVLKCRRWPFLNIRRVHRRFRPSRWRSRGSILWTNRLLPVAKKRLRTGFSDPPSRHSLPLL